MSPKNRLHLRENFAFLLDGCRKYEPTVFVLFALFTVCSALLPFVSVLLPKVLVAGLEQKWALNRILLSAGMLGAAGMALGGGQEKALRSGTENTPGIAGLLAAIEAYPRDNNMRAVKLHLYERLRESAGENFRVNGPDPASEIAAPHILNCSLVPVRSETMLYALEGDRVYVANGSACSSRKQKLSPVLSAMNVPRRQAESAIRFSICPYTTMEQVDFAADCIARHYEMLKRYERR